MLPTQCGYVFWVILRVTDNGFLPRNILVFVVKMFSPILVAVRSKAWVWNRSIAGTTGLNLTEGMNVVC
jgi:hypothetical protein